MRIFSRREDGAGGPVATYAAVLDGAHLWWHVPGHDRLVLRDETGAEVVVDADPFALTGPSGLPGLSATRYDVLADGRRVLSPTLPQRRPSRAPLAPDGAQYDVEVTEGHLQVTRRTAELTAVLTCVGLVDGEIRLDVTVPRGIGPGAGLVLADEDDRVLTVLAGTSFGVADLPPGHVGVLRLGVGDADRWVRVRRSRTDLADPNHAVLLPELTDPDQPDEPRARLRWSPDSLLALRMLETPGGPDVADAP